MNTEQIIKALECCYIQEQNCPECPYTDIFPECQEQMGKNALTLIKKQQAELTFCYDKLTELEKEILGLSLRNITLKKENKYLRESLADEREHREDMEGHH